MSFTLWFMGLPASGKSTLARQVESELSERGIDTENLDGDDLRKNLHPDLGFSREERSINNRRTAYISRILNKNGISSIVAMITPFRDAQQQAREIVENEGEFVLVYVKCPVDVCAERDPKNLYAQAKEGKIENFTGVNHPFEEPLNPEIIVDTERQGIDQCTTEILSYLEEHVIDSEPEGEYEFDVSRKREREIRERLRELGYLE